MVRSHSAPRPIRTRFYTPPDIYQPIAAINTTPLIDMMLVLLIMFIVAIPLRTHEVPLDLPAPAPPATAPRPVHRLDIAAGDALRWDGRPIAAAELRTRLAGLAADPADPELHLAAVGDARYERVDQVLADIQRAGITRLGFVGNHMFERAIDR